MGNGNQDINQQTLDLPLTTANASALLVIIDSFIQNTPTDGEVQLKPEDIPEGMTEEDFRAFHKQILFEANFLREEVTELLREQFLTDDQETKSGIILPHSKFE